MKKVKLIASLLVLIFIYSCSSSHPKYREGEPESNFNYPGNKEIEKSIYLLGDGGYSPPGGTSLGLLAFRSFLDSVHKPQNYTIFLGDNIYPDGMPPESSPDREAAEYRIDAQLNAIKNYEGNVVVIPGNHDWYNEKLEGLEREKEYLKENFDETLIWSPEIGCGLESISISENIQLIVLDSQWYLEDWDNNPRINDNCGKINTREAMFQQLIAEIGRNSGKTIIVALHHPLYTNGVHGGQYTFTRHIYPSQKKIPLPILGSLATLIRTTGGVSIQDAQNNRYKSLVTRLTKIAQGSKNLVFVSGHEHSLQYIEHEGVKQIVSGSGSKASYATLSNDGLFAYPGQGFAVLDIFEDGSSWVSFYGNEHNKPKLLYQKEIIKNQQPEELKNYNEDFPSTITTSIYDKEEKEKQYKTIWGQKYADLYKKDIKLPVADLDTLYGGLKILSEGFKDQNPKLIAADGKGREYELKKVQKKALRVLQNIATRNDPVNGEFRNSLTDKLIQDFYTAAHPYGFLAIPELSEAASLLHTNPKIFYLPKQSSLGKFNEEHGDDIYMIVERPGESWKGEKVFEMAEDIVSTSEMIESLRKDQRNSLDERAYIRARIFDMLIGDWDRDQSRWNWAKIKNGNGNYIFKPIPKDRDQVFSNYDGANFGSLKALSGFSNQFEVYGSDLDDVAWFNTAALGLDRSLIQNTGRNTWQQEAEFIRQNITDEIIESAFHNLPEETKGEATDELIKNLKGRRDNILDITQKYYVHLSNLAIVTATDQRDYLEVVRLKNGSTRIIISRDDNGKKGEKLSDKTYHSWETEEIWLYGLDEEDKILVSGEGPAEILIRIVGGKNNDSYTVDYGKNIKIYDHKSLPNTITKAGSAKFRFTDDYEINTYDKDKRTYAAGSILPEVGFNPDEGFSAKVKLTRSVNKFKRNPFTSQHSFVGEFHSATNGFRLNYEGEFATILGEYNLLAGVNYTSPDWSTNFFGFGNETSNFEDELGMNYNRVGLNEISAKIGLENKTPFGSFFGFTTSFESIQVEEYRDRFISEVFNTNVPDFYGRKYFAGLDAKYKYESYDDVLNPTRGMRFVLNLGAKQNTSETDRQYGYFKTYMGFYNALTRNRKLVIKTRADLHLNIGDEYEFYQAASLGAENGLRGYRLARYTGKGAFGTGADLRYSFDKWDTGFLPLQMGVYTGYDLGRVWIDEEDSKRWHDSYGGGLWINSSEALSGTLSLFAGSEGPRFEFQFRFKF